MLQKKAKNTKRLRLLSLILTITISATANSLPSYAGTDHSNNTANTADSSAVMSENAALPANPIHHCTYDGSKENTTNWKKDTTTWSYLYFGSYPQSEVTDAATITAINSAIAAKRISRKSCTDVWANGTKYRRVLFFNDSDENDYRYFKWEPIKWKVLDNNDNGTLFIAADCVLDCVSYIETGDISTFSWETSDIRYWLNDSFYQYAFSPEEQNAISAWHVVNNEKHPYYGTTSGKDTTDKIYLLSYKEATNANYGFCSNSASSLSRQIRPSAYAYANGAKKNTGESYELEGCFGCSSWWLRSIGDDSNAFDDISPSTSSIEQDGTVSAAYTYHGKGVVPALHINLSSAFWSSTETNTNNDVKTKVASIDINIPSEELAAGISLKLSVDIKPKSAVNKKIIWKTSNRKYATVKNNKLTIKKAGIGEYVTITAIAADGSGVTGICSFYIMKHAVKRIKLSAPSKSVKAGRSIQIKASVQATGNNANKILKWTSSNPKYATVTDLGKVKTKKAGKNKMVTITATSTDGSNKKAKITLRIK